MSDASDSLQLSLSLSIDRFSLFLRDIPIDKRANFVLETGKFIAPVDSELFSVGFQSSSDVQTDGNLWIHERCLKWALADGEKHPDYELVRTAVLNAAQQVSNHEVISLPRQAEF